MTCQTLSLSSGPPIGITHAVLPLQVGVLKARQLAAEYALPLVPVHHMEAHALVARLSSGGAVHFPFLVLLVSGGHNLLMVVEGVGRYVQLGTTLDDAIGGAGGIRQGGEGSQCDG